MEPLKAAIWDQIHDADNHWRAEFMDAEAKRQLLLLLRSVWGYFQGRDLTDVVEILNAWAEIDSAAQRKPNPFRDAVDPPVIDRAVASVAHDFMRAALLKIYTDAGAAGLSSQDKESQQ